MRFVVGIDGGGTRTRAVVLDERGVERGRAYVMGCVVTASAPEPAAAAVGEAVRAAAARAGAALPFTALWAGLAGAGREDARAAVHARLAGADLAERVEVGTDVEAAFHDAFADGPGLLLVAGTGSIAWGRLADGTTVRVGGWGRDLGDEGSGWAIGRAALRSVLRAEDGRAPATRMREPILERCRVSEPIELVSWMETATKADVAALVPVVVEAAARLDPAAASIVEEAVAALDAHVGALLARVGPTPDPPRLVLWGGLLAPGGPLRGAMRQALRGRAATVLDVEPDPPLGAARKALALLDG